ncbi:DUF6968 family protein [Nocardia abscessus]|uniref:DUF6968 family protein n=1 Tax=Nocardia abscessus TaxID=120957 RepID=UPI0024584531|nr:hypothetical protein [Nocardia abscessus]
MIEFGEPIATRVFDSPNGEITARIGKPVQQDGLPDWFCPWTIEGFEAGPITNFAMGVDAMQALIFALAAVGDRIAAESVPVSFLGDEANLCMLHTELGLTDRWQATVSFPTVFG